MSTVTYGSLLRIKCLKEKEARKKGAATKTFRSRDLPQSDSVT